MSKLILASSSPRRKDILQQLGLKFDIISSNIEEVFDKNLNPEEVAKSLAYQKAYDVASNLKGEYLIIGSDTIVVLNNEILGKPYDEHDVYSMLRKLSGKTHQVMTGLCVYNTKDNSYLAETDINMVRFREISDEEIASYIKSGEPFDKAGSYAIQGLAAVFVEHIEGTYSGIVGLPIYTLDKMLKHYGINIL